MALNPVTETKTGDITAKPEASQESKEQETASKAKAQEPVQPGKKEEITIDDFDKLELRVGQIIDCQKHPKADKLLVSQVKLGDEVRQIVSGVAKLYTPEDMIGKKVMVIANLKPVKLRGEESKGMILFADGEGENLHFVTTDGPDGAGVR